MKTLYLFLRHLKTNSQVCCVLIGISLLCASCNSNNSGNPGRVSNIAQIETKDTLQNWEKHYSFSVLNVGTSISYSIEDLSKGYLSLLCINQSQCNSCVSDQLKIIKQAKLDTVVYILSANPVTQRTFRIFLHMHDIKPKYALLINEYDSIPFFLRQSEPVLLKMYQGKIVKWRLANDYPGDSAIHSLRDFLKN
jgi:hypothetical protein